ncbi:type II toxin-antitoxin system PemK/MazF family toxin [Sphingomonas sp.]|uniref:type II toxin-antitoxin system PemK/MazF family toxin n=1 Tax=Sphingomonas sp. TaxID=28214 RepID=UPI0035BC20AA
MKRGEVWLCRLDPTVGSEISTTRPLVIVSPDDLNKRLRTVLVAPLTSGSHATAFRVPVAFGGVDGLIMPDQMRTLDRQRLLKRLGEIDASALSTTLAVLTAMFAE